MAAEVHVPAVGPVSRRALLLGGGAAVALMGFLWWRKRQAAGAPAAATDSSGADLTADDSSGMAGGGGSLTGPSQPTATTFVSNPQWEQAAMQTLDGVVDAGLLSTALGAYLTGSAVTADQESLIDQARAAEGDPPVAGPNGYPPAIRTQPSGGQSNTGQPPPAPTGFAAWPRSSTEADIWWQPAPGANGYTVWLRRQGSSDTWTTVGSVVAGSGSPGGGTQIIAHGLTPGQPYEVVVRAENAAGYGPYSNIIAVETAK